MLLGVVHNRFPANKGQFHLGLSELSIGFCWWKDSALFDQYSVMIAAMNIIRRIIIPSP